MYVGGNAMSYLYDFPHTRKYDDDLGFLIEYYKEVKEAYDGTWARINELADYLETHLPELASEYLDNALKEGRIAVNLKYSAEDTSLSFSYTTLPKRVVL